MHADSRPKRGLSQLLGLALKFVFLTFFVTLVFLIAVLAIFPARAVTQVVTPPAQVTAIYGSLWNGRVTLTGGYVVEWRTDPGQIVFGRFTGDAVLKGADTQVTGTFAATPFSLSAQDIAGRAGPGLLQLFPALLVESCETRAVVDIAAIRLDRKSAFADGTVAIDAGTCTDTSGTVITLPQTRVNLGSEARNLTAVLSDRDSQLAKATLASDRRLILRVEPEGAVLIPGLPTGGPIIIEYPF
jgi:hypothetical protein